MEVQESEKENVQDLSINRAVVLQLFTREAKAADKKSKEAADQQNKETADQTNEEAADKVIQRINRFVKSKDIKERALTKWLEHAIIERKTLIQSFKDTKSAIEKLNLLILGIVFILLFIIWLLILKILTTNILILLLSQSFALTFMLSATAKSGLEGIIFVFVTHPFDIGDLCLINGEEMVVEKINLSTTIFRKESREKIIYRNSVLTTMAIKDFNRGTADVEDSLELTIDRNTTDEQIDDLYYTIKNYMEEGNDWIPARTLSALKEIEEQKMKMVLYFTCRDINVQRSVRAMVWRRDALIKALKIICISLNIKCYDIRPQAVDPSYSAFLAPARKE